MNILTPFVTNEINKILIVDDDAITRQTMALILKSFKSFEIFQARNGQVARNIINSNNIDLILIDYRLPSETGIDIINDIKDKGYNKNIILITGADELPHITNIQCIIKKPINLKELKAYFKQQNIL